MPRPISYAVFCLKQKSTSLSTVQYIQCRSYRSEEHTSELQSQSNLVCRLLLEKTHRIWELRRRTEQLSSSCAATQSHAGCQLVIGTALVENSQGFSARRLYVISSIRCFAPWPV